MDGWQRPPSGFSTGDRRSPLPPGPGPWKCVCLSGARAGLFSCRGGLERALLAFSEQGWGCCTSRDVAPTMICAPPPQHAAHPPKTNQPWSPCLVRALHWVLPERAFSECKSDDASAVAGAFESLSSPCRYSSPSNVCSTRSCLPAASSPSTFSLPHSPNFGQPFPQQTLLKRPLCAPSYPQ